LRWANDLACRFDYGIPEAILKPLDGDRVRGHDPHFGEPRQKALESTRDPGIER
jgi:hypothetical protein